MPELFKLSDTQSNAESKKETVVKPSTYRMMSAFMVRPNGVRFETQQDEEEILLFMRQHLITNLGWILTTLVLFLIPMLVTPVLFSLGVVPQNLPPGYFLVLPLIWYLGVFGFAFTNFLHWYYNVYIVTNERVVDIDWISLLYKQLSSTQISKIQDVTYKQGGILDSFFDFGDVFIQTAGTEPNFEFAAVPKPNQVVREIDRIIENIQEGGK